MANEKGVYVGVEDDDSDNESEAADEDLGNIWNEMAMSIECSKVYMSQHIVVLGLDVASLRFLAFEIVSRKLILRTSLLKFDPFFATFPALFISDYNKMYRI